MTTRSAVQASPRLVPLAATVLAGAIAALLESTITAWRWTSSGATSPCP